MTFLQALYGSQYREIAQQGKDGRKGRFNGNLLLSVCLMLLLLIAAGLLFRIVPALSRSVSGSLSGWISGSTLGKLLALPLVFGIHALVARTLGSPARFDQHVAAFLQLPETEQQRANHYVLTRFLALLAAMAGMVVCG